MNTTNTFKFANIFAAITKEINDRANDKKSIVNDENATIKSLLNMWQIKDLLPTSKKGYNWELKELKTYLIKRIDKQTAKNLDSELLRLTQLQMHQILKVQLLQ